MNRHLVYENVSSPVACWARCQCWNRLYNLYIYKCCSLMLTLRIPLLEDNAQTSTFANPLCNYSSINKQRGYRPLHVLCRRWFKSRPSPLRLQRSTAALEPDANVIGGDICLSGEGKVLWVIDAAMTVCIMGRQKGDQPTVGRTKTVSTKDESYLLLHSDVQNYTFKVFRITLLVRS